MILLRFFLLVSIVLALLCLYAAVPSNFDADGESAEHAGAVSTQTISKTHPHILSTPPIALTGSCETLPDTHEERLINPCAKVVTYSFFVPGDSSTAAMEVRARNMLNSSVLQASGQTCASRMVRLICGNIYRRCKDNVDFNDYSTYDYGTYTADANVSTVGLPFDRPCLSVCSQAAQSCSGTLFFSSTTPPNCSERVDYSRGTAPGGTALVRRYDPSNTPQCYVPATVTVSAQVEDYIPKGNLSSFCSGYASRILIGSGVAVNDTYTVLQEPNTLQNIINQRLQGLAFNLPPFLSSDCMAAAKKYFCYQTLLAPQGVTIRRALENSDLPNLQQVITQITNTNPALLTSVIFMPRLPPRSICLDYEEKCSSFISRVNNTNLTPNCNGTIRNRPGVVAFPTKNQTFTTVVTNSGLSIKFPAAVNDDLYYNTSEMATYTPTCPRGYIKPDDPDHEDVRWISFSVCAVPCKVNVWTQNEWKSLINFSHLVPFVGIAFSALTLIFLCWNMQDMDKNYPLFAFVLLSFLSSLTSTVISEGWSDDDRFCESNAVPFRQEYGYSVCTVQGAITTYCVLACCFCLLVTAIHICVYTSPYTYVLKHPAYYAFQSFGVLGTPIIFVSIVGSYEGFGFARSQPWCYVLPPAADPSHLDFKLTGLPVLGGTLACIAVLIIHSIAFHTCHVNARPYSTHRVHIAHAEDDDGGGILSLHSNKDENNKTSAIELPTYAEHLTPTEDDRVMEVGSPREEDDEDIRRANPRSLSAQSNNSHTPNHYTNVHVRPLPQNNLVHKPASMLRYKLLVLVICFVIFIPYFSSKLNAVQTIDRNRDAYADFTQCVFQNFRGDDEDWETECGEHPSFRPSSTGVLFLCVALCGSMIIVGPIMICCLGIDLCLRSAERGRSMFEDS